MRKFEPAQIYEVNKTSQLLDVVEISQILVIDLDVEPLQFVRHTV